MTSNNHTIFHFLSPDFFSYSPISIFESFLLTQLIACMYTPSYSSLATHLYETSHIHDLEQLAPMSCGLHTALLQDASLKEQPQEISLHLVTSSYIQSNIFENTIQIDDHHSISYQHITYPATLVEAYQTMMNLFPMIRILF